MGSFTSGSTITHNFHAQPCYRGHFVCLCPASRLILLSPCLSEETGKCCLEESITERSHCLSVIHTQGRLDVRAKSVSVFRLGATGSTFLSPVLLTPSSLPYLCFCLFTSICSFLTCLKLPQLSSLSVEINSVNTQSCTGPTPFVSVFTKMS